MDEYNNLTVVSIDDNDHNNILIEAYLEIFNKEYLCEYKLDFISFTDPREGLEHIKNNSIDILYVDYNMPFIDGITLIKDFRKVNKNTPIIMITAHPDDEDNSLYKEAFIEGVNDFLFKPIAEKMMDFNLRTKSLLELSISRRELRLLNKNLESKVIRKTKDIRNRELETLSVLAEAAEGKDADTRKHTDRVAFYSKLLAENCDEIPKENREEYIDKIFYGSPLHDIGKLGVLDAILRKPGRLDDDEMKIMRKHPTIGYDILLLTKQEGKSVQSKYLTMGASISISHHEKFDGTGYPNGITGKEIPLCGRIVAIADVFDALTSVRPYKKAWSFEDAIKFLSDESGKHFDPELVEIFINNSEKVREIYINYLDKEEDFNPEPLL